MKVIELIEKLKEFPEEMEVEIFKEYDPEFGQSYYLELEDFKVVENKLSA